MVVLDQFLDPTEKANGPACNVEKETNKYGNTYDWEYGFNYICKSGKAQSGCKACKVHHSHLSV